MKKIIILLFLSFLILAGAGCEKESTEESLTENKVGLANPASVYCEEQGGSLEMRNAEAGQYGVCIFSNGSECEEWAYFRGECLPVQTGLPAGQELKDEEISKATQESRELAEIWIKNNAPTYLFDGSDLRYLESRVLDCVDCYKHIFIFKSSQAGFGDRTGQILAQVITPHEIVVEVKGKSIVSAITNNGFDEITEEILLRADEIRQIKVSLIPRNDSLESGVAILSEELGKVKVIINVANYPDGIRPAYIQAGDCGDLGAVKYILESVAEGNSETLLDTSLDNLLSQLPLVINIKKDLASSALCGEIVGR